MFKLIILLAVLAAMFSACGKHEETKSVEYYWGHPSELKTKLDEGCLVDAQKAKTTNCKNAVTAWTQPNPIHDKELADKFRKSGPIIK